MSDSTFLNDEVFSTLLYGLQKGALHQRHDSAKALGYIALSGALKDKHKAEVSVNLLNKLTSFEEDSRVAFAMLEALSRADNESFWALILNWYEQLKRMK